METSQREFLTELSVALATIAAAVAMALLMEHQPGSLGLLAWLTLVCAVLIPIEFEVGDGLTRPIQLAVVPMLLLAPPGLVPLALIVAHLPAMAARVLGRGLPPSKLVLSAADSSFSLAPALVVVALGPVSGAWGAAAVCLAALAALMASDLAISAFRMRVGLGIDPRGELRGFMWMYLVDLCLAPVAFLAALAGREHPALVACVLPLAALLVVFARERRGRLRNALKLQRVAQEGRERLQSIVQNSSDCIAIVGADGTLRTLTGSVEPLFGSGWERVEGESLFAHTHPQDAAPVAAFLESVAAKDEPQEGEWRMRFADGTHRHVAVAATNLVDDERIAGIVLTIRDVETRKAFEEELRHQAFHDALTGLPNRALFYDRVEHALNRGARVDGGVAVLFIDLDDFKTINDVRGHAEGDRLLQEIARRLDLSLRSTDTAARLGGDEFGVLLESAGGVLAVAATAARLLDVVAQPIELPTGPVSVSASIGIAVASSLDRGAEECLRKADLAMYEAKRGGRGRFELYDARLDDGGAGGRWFARDDEQRAEIRAVLEDPEGLSMVFQPIMDLRTGRVAGFEALARFAREPFRTPDVWFAQAHRCGLGYALEAKAVATALATLGRPADTYLALNLSPSSLLSDEVLRVLPEDLDGIVIEITENELVGEDGAIQQAFADLRARGARLAVDDVGAGYAGLTHVMRLRPDIIKLDRALTTEVDHDPDKAPLIRSFVRYAADIGATVCAEGIETLAELRRLADLDVAVGQGYGIARPAAPWVAVAPEAAATCLDAFRAALADDGDRFAALAGRLVGLASVSELDGLLGALASELGADEVRLAVADAAPAGATQLLADDPGADPLEAAALRAEGFASRVTLPIPHGERIVGRLEVYAREPRPWSRLQVSRARLVCSQLGPVLGAPVTAA